MPLRDNSTTFELLTADGLRLRGIHYPAPRPRAVVGIVHGLGEHYGRYDEVVRRFLPRGISCYAFDQRGHGRSDGERGYTPSYDHFLDDLALLVDKMRDEQPALPVFLYGQSMGGNLVSNYLLRRDASDLSGALVTSPWLHLRWGMRFGWIVLSNFFKLVWPTLSRYAWMNPERLSSDPEVGVRFGADDRVHRRIHPRTFVGMHRAGHYAVAHAGEIDVPVYVAHGDRDPITSPRASRQFAERSGGEFRLWENMLHETHHERDYERVIDTMAGWILSRTEAHSEASTAPGGPAASSAGDRPPVPY